MNYPLSLTRADGGVVGHAVANDEDEHRALSEAGYLPAHQPTEAPQPAVRRARSAAPDKAGDPA